MRLNDDIHHLNKNILFYLDKEAVNSVSVTADHSTE